uniref:Uncharacterized protein n=1 Tax=Magnetospirillum gryphiswaldense TaxID=55518 RepID=A4U2J0_9PROT|nr:hypothetical protein MGR_3600 [Magnetospirillum gryphiswaldense MSR-1]
MPLRGNTDERGFYLSAFIRANPRLSVLRLEGGHT